MKITIIITSLSIVSSLFSQSTNNFYVMRSEQTGLLVTNYVPEFKNMLPSSRRPYSRNLEEVQRIQAKREAYDKAPSSPKLSMDEIFELIEKYREEYGDIFDDYETFKYGSANHAYSRGGSLSGGLKMYCDKIVRENSKITFVTLIDSRINGVMSKMEFEKFPQEQIEANTNRCMAARMAALNDFLNPNERDGYYERDELSLLICELWDEDFNRNKFDGISIQTVFKHVVLNEKLPLYVRMLVCNLYATPKFIGTNSWYKLPVDDFRIVNMMKTVLTNFHKTEDAYVSTHYWGSRESTYENKDYEKKNGYFNDMEFSLEEEGNKRFVMTSLDYFKFYGTIYDTIPFLQKINEGTPPLWKRNAIDETISEIQKRQSSPNSTEKTEIKHSDSDLSIEKLLQNINKYRNDHVDVFEEYTKHKNKTINGIARNSVGILSSFMRMFCENINSHIPKSDSYVNPQDKKDKENQRKTAAIMAALDNFIDPSESIGYYERQEISSLIYLLWSYNISDTNNNSILNSNDFSNVFKHVIYNKTMPLHARMYAWIRIPDGYKSIDDEQQIDLLKTVLSNYHKEAGAINSNRQQNVDLSNPPFKYKDDIETNWSCGYMYSTFEERAESGFGLKVLTFFKDYGNTNIIPFLKKINEGNPPLWKRKGIDEAVVEITKRNEFVPQEKPVDIELTKLTHPPITFKNMLGSRDPGQRGSLLVQGGRYEGGEATVMRALRWLKFKQQPDGSWPGQPVINTSLALLCYLRHGDSSNPDMSPEFAETVKNGILYLVNAQKEDGFFYPKDDDNYAHLLATYALAETYFYSDSKTLRPIVEKAITHIIKNQQPNGGWDLNLNPDSGQTDISYSIWAVLSLHTLLMHSENSNLIIFGVKESYKNAVNGIVQKAHPSGGFGRVDPIQSAYSGIGVYGLQMLGSARLSEVKNGLEFLMNCKTSFVNWDIDQPWGEGYDSPIYYWYFISQAKFLKGGQDWKEWNGTFMSELPKNQQIIMRIPDENYNRPLTYYKGVVVGTNNVIKDVKGDWRDVGYWDSPSALEFWGENGGEIYPPDSPYAPKRWKKGVKLTDTASCTTTDGQRIQITALCILPLMVYYASMPSYRSFEFEYEELKPKENVNSIDETIFEIQKRQSSTIPPETPEPKTSND